jgi:hypothetical protein
MIFRLYYRILGGHVHCRLFAGNGPSLGKCGDLTMRVDEFAAFKAAASFIQFIPTIESKANDR